MNLLSSLFVVVLTARSAFAFLPLTQLRTPSLTQLAVSTAEAPAADLTQGLDQPSVCLITGSSQGLGQAMAFELAKYGHTIVVNHFPGQEENAEATLQKIRELGGDGMTVPADITHVDEVEAMIKTAMDKFGRLDVLINNSGITKDNLVPRMKNEDFAAVISVNLSGAWYVTQAFIRAVVDNLEVQENGARIINIASVVGQIGNPGQANYAASKGGLIGLTKSLAVECAPNKIKVNAVCPGFIETPMTAKLTPDQLEKSLRWIPLHRFGKPEEVAAMARFLAVDKGADYLTGHCFDVDGGVGIASA